MPCTVLRIFLLQSTTMYRQYKRSCAIDCVLSIVRSIHERHPNVLKHARSAGLRHALSLCSMRIKKSANLDTTTPNSALDVGRLTLMRLLRDNFTRSRYNNSEVDDYQSSRVGIPTLGVDAHLIEMLHLFVAFAASKNTGKLSARSLFTRLCLSRNRQTRVGNRAAARHHHAAIAGDIGLRGSPGGPRRGQHQHRVGILGAESGP